MTLLSFVLKESVKSFQKPKRKRSNFIDSLRIHVQGGAGGMGHPKYGGVGGRGGRVFVEGKEDMTLKDLKSSMKSGHKVKASQGQNSSARCILGRPGDDLVIQCPPGIVVMSEYGNKLGEVMKEGDMVMVADGGVGGNQATGYCGSKGQAHTVRLDLKLIADVAFVGFPNAGKSTLLSKLSRATPKIASYPFTTMRPTVGMVEFPDGRVISLADLPGLIEGAHVNRGLGHHFLRHVERSKVLLLVVDIGGFQLSHKYQYRSCLETILLLNREIELYKEPLLDKPAMLLMNKMDTPNATETCHQVTEAAMDLSQNTREQHLPGKSMQHRSIDQYNLEWHQGVVLRLLCGALVLPGVLHKFPEEFRPERLFDFVSIQNISAMNASQEELKEYKQEIRRVLDLAASEAEAETETEAQLLQKFRQKQTEYGPSLV